jgi:hypothetical protein
MPKRREQAVVSLVAFLLIVAASTIYWPALRTPYFGDNLMCIFPGWPLDLGFFLTHHGYDAHSFRPLQNLMLAAIQSRFGWETWPIHSIEFLLHICLCGLIFVAARWLGFTMTQAGVATAFAMLWQFAAMAIVALSVADVGSALFGFASVLVLGSACQAARGDRRAVLVGASVFCYVIAAFFKETSAGYLAVIILCLVFWQRGSGPMRAARVAALVAPYIAVEAVYFALRIQTVALRPRDVYVFGANLVRNVGLILVSAVTQVSSVTVATAVHRKNILVLLAVAVLSALTVALAIGGIRKCGRSRLAGFLPVLAFVVLGPVIPLRHVSELYMYAAMPFLALLYGLAMGTLVEDRRWRMPVGAFIALSLALNAHAANSKARMVDANARRAMAMIDAIRRALPEVPQGGKILLSESPPDYEYSIFVVHGADVLKVGAQRLGPLLGRPDVALEVVTQARGQILAPDRGTFVFTFQDGAMLGR